MSTKVITKQYNAHLINSTVHKDIPILLKIFPDFIDLPDGIDLSEEFKKTNLELNTLITMFYFDKNKNATEFHITSSNVLSKYRINPLKTEYKEKIELAKNLEFYNQLRMIGLAK